MKNSISQLKNIFIGDTVTNAGVQAKNALNHFVDAVAVLFITACGIPVAVLFLMLWVMKILFGIEVPASKLTKRKRINTTVQSSEKELAEPEYV